MILIITQVFSPHKLLQFGCHPNHIHTDTSDFHGFIISKKSPTYPRPPITCLWFGNPFIFVFWGTWGMFQESFGILLDHGFSPWSCEEASKRFSPEHFAKTNWQKPRWNPFFHSKTRCNQYIVIWPGAPSDREILTFLDFQGFTDLLLSVDILDGLFMHCVSSKNTWSRPEIQSKALAVLAHTRTEIHVLQEQVAQRLKL